MYEINFTCAGTQKSLLTSYSRTTAARRLREYIEAGRVTDPFAAEVLSILESQPGSATVWGLAFWFVHDAEKRSQEERRKPAVRDCTPKDHFADWPQHEDGTPKKIGEMSTADRTRVGRRALQQVAGELTSAGLHTVAADDEPPMKVRPTRRDLKAAATHKDAPKGPPEHVAANLVDAFGIESAQEDVAAIITKVPDEVKPLWRKVAAHLDVLAKQHRRRYEKE
jgi:hypothetical protein